MAGGAALLVLLVIAGAVVAGSGGDDDADAADGTSTTEAADGTDTCEDAAGAAVEDEPFDPAACESLVEFRTVYRQVAGERLALDDLEDVLGEACDDEADARVCEDLDAILSPSTTSTTRPRPTTTTAPPIGTQENPIPAGLPVPLDDWTFSVVGFEADVTGIVQDANQFNDLPGPGQTFVRMRVSATYEGEGSGSPGFALRFNLAGASGTSYEEALVASGGANADPEVLRNRPETFPGGTIEGWVYYIVSTEDAGGRLLGFAPNVTYTDVPGGVGFFVVKP